MSSGLGVPSIVPSNGPMSRRPFPFGGVSWGEFPRVLGTVRRSDFLPPFPARSLPRSPVPPASCVRLPPDRTPPGSAGVLLTQTTQTGCCYGGGRISQVPGEPPCVHALLPSDPGGTSASGPFNASVLPSAHGTASAPAHR